MSCLLLFPEVMRRFWFLVVVLFIPWELTSAKFDEFDDGDDIVEYDDNDFAEFEDVIEDPATESPQRIVTAEDDEEEATVELEGQDESLDFEDTEGQVMLDAGSGLFLVQGRDADKGIVKWTSLSFCETKLNLESV